MSETVDSGEPSFIPVSANPYNTYGLATQGFVLDAIEAAAKKVFGRVRYVNGESPDLTGNVDVSMIRTVDYSGGVNQVNADLTVLQDGVPHRLLTEADYAEISGGLDSRVDSLSAYCVGNITDISETSGDWDSVYSSVSSASGDWNEAKTEADSVYTTVASASGDWSNAFAKINRSAPIWDAVATKVKDSSADWDSVYSTVKSASGNWNDAANKEEWDSVYSSVYNTSGDWNSVYSSVFSTSATWNTTAHDAITAAEESARNANDAKNSADAALDHADHADHAAADAAASAADAEQHAVAAQQIAADAANTANAAQQIAAVAEQYAVAATNVAEQAHSKSVEAYAKALDVENVAKSVYATVDAASGDWVWKKGESDYSAILDTAESNHAFSQFCVVEGVSNTAGLKGYRYTDSGNVSGHNYLDFETVPYGWSNGDVVSVINKTKYENALKISSISGNRVNFTSTLPFTSIIAESDFDSRTAYVLEKPLSGNVELGYAAHAEGASNLAINTFAHAEGFETSAVGQYSHAEGRDNYATYAAHAEGQETKAYGDRSHSEGLSSIASGGASHAEGHKSEASNYAAHAEGASVASGRFSHAEGYQTQSLASTDSGKAHANHAEGIGTQAGYGALVVDPREGQFGVGAHAEGGGTAAAGRFAHAEGLRTYAYGIATHAAGVDTTAYDNGAHSEGNWTYACGKYSHSEGESSKTTSTFTFSGAANTKTYTTSSAAQDNAHGLSVGDILNYPPRFAKVVSIPQADKFTVDVTLSTTAVTGNNLIIVNGCSYGQSSHVEGISTIAYNKAEHAQGQFNKSNKANDTFGNAGNTLYSIGIGSNKNSRRNAVEVMQDGSVFVKGIGGYDGTNPSSSASLSGKSSVWDSVAASVETSSGYWNSTIAEVSNKADKSEVDPLLFKQWYPDGSVTNASQFTQGLKYDLDTVNKTASVKPFCYTGDSSNDNSDIFGDVVIPPYVESNGVRYVVSAILGASDVNDYSPNLTSIKAPTTVKSIGDSAFYNCTSLASVSLPSATSIGDSAFSYCTSLSSVSLPSATSIGDYAFNSCASLASVSLPAATSIGDYAFNSCASLASVSLPSATSIGDGAFNYCDSLASVSLPSATSIGDGVFNSCTSLSSVSLPAATSIGDYAFSDCTPLAIIDFGKDTRSSVPTLGSDAFSGVTTNQLTFVVPDTNYNAWIAASGWSSLYNAGAKFVKYSEWEAPHRYELSQKASMSDLPYRLVEPGEWKFGALPSGVLTVDQPYWDEFNNSWQLSINGDAPIPSLHGEPENTMSLEWEYEGSTITATRASLPGHLIDRAVNAVSVTGATTLTLPSLVTGKSRDFYLKMTVTGSQNVTFSPSTGITYTGYGNPANTYSAGTYLLRFTEAAENEFCVTDMLAQKANAADLPYSLVTAEQTGEWQFSGSPEITGISIDLFDVFVDTRGETEESVLYMLQYNDSLCASPVDAVHGLKEVVFSDVAVYDPNNFETSLYRGRITATRAYALQDRAVNIVSPTVTSTTEWMWTDGETGTPVNNDGYWTVQDASFEYDGPVAGTGSETEITFPQSSTKTFTYYGNVYDEETGNEMSMLREAISGDMFTVAFGYDGEWNRIITPFEYDGVTYNPNETVYYNESPDTTFTATGTVAEHVVTKTTTYGPTITLTMPQAAVPGRVRDLIARIGLSQAVGVPPVEFSGGAFEAVDGEMPELVKGVNLMSFTETAEGVFAVAYKEVKPISQGGS